MSNEGIGISGPQYSLPTDGNGRYKLAAKLGEGWMASVYKCWDELAGEWRALKVLLPEFSRKRKLRKRLGRIWGTRKST